MMMILFKESKKISYFLMPKYLYLMIEGVFYMIRVDFTVKLFDESLRTV
jgi:hypothetical protein